MKAPTTKVEPGPPNCAACPFAVDGKPPHAIVMGEVPEGPEGVLVGEGPGNSEVQMGRPFVGTTGKRLDETLRECSLQRGNLAVLNATACRPPLSKNESMMRAAVKACAPLFARQYTALAALPTLAMGKWAGGAVESIRHGKLEPRPIKTARGFLRDENTLILTWHPTFAFFHNPWERASFEEDFRRFSRMIKKRLLLFTPRLYLDSTNALEEVLRRACAGEAVAVDIETSGTKDGQHLGKNPIYAKLRRLGLGFHDMAVSFAASKITGETKRRIKLLLSSAHLKKIGANYTWFDARVMERYNMPAENVDDVRDMRRAVSTTSPLALRYLGSIYTDVPPWKEDESDETKGLVFTKDEKKLGIYNGWDCVITARVHAEIKAEDEWKKSVNPHTPKLLEVHTDLSRIAAKMHTRGFAVNEKVRRRLDVELLTLHKTKKQELLKHVSDPAFKGSPDDMRSLIFERHRDGQRRCFGMPDPLDKNHWTDDERTKCSVDKATLLFLYIHPSTPPELRDIIQLYWHAASPQKARSTYVTGENVLNAIGPDGRLRAGWNSCGTETMRFSCSEPNLMNLSEKKDADSLGGELPNIREMYEAGRGMALVHADYSQQELRIMEAVSGDAFLRHALDVGDVYSVNAQAWFALTDDLATIKEKHKGLRKGCKIIHLGSQYAAGIDAIYVQGLMQDRALKYSHAQLCHRKWLESYKETVAYWHNEEEWVQASGYSEGRILFGRRYYPDTPPITEVANYPIQRTAGEMTALAMVKLDAALERFAPSAGIVTILHDAFDVECREKDVPVVKKLLEECMVGPWEMRGNHGVVKREMPVEIKVGHSWKGL